MRFAIVLVAILGFGVFAVNGILEVEAERDRKEIVVENLPTFNPNWEKIQVEDDSKTQTLFRTKTPNGWLVKWNRGYGSDLEYIPDANHYWNEIWVETSDSTRDD